MKPDEKEYAQLYEEIGRNAQICANVFLGNISVTAILIGFGIEFKNSYLFLAPFIMMIPSLLFIASQMECTTKIASYIKVFHEAGENGPRWETRWKNFHAGNSFTDSDKYTMAVSGLYGILGILCLLFFWLWGNGEQVQFYHTNRMMGTEFFNNQGKIFITIILLALHGVGIIFIYRAYSQKMVNKYTRKWEKLKKDEEAGGKAS